MKLNKYDIYLIYDKPINVNGLILYPITLDKYIEFTLCVSCLLLDKNSIPDAKIISMSYLEYLIYLYNGNNETFFTMLDYLLKLVLKRPDSKISFGTNKNGRGFFAIDGVSYDNSVFDEIREVICVQNSIELPDENIQKEIRDKMEEARKLKRRLSKSSPAPFEDQMVCAMIATGLSMEEIYNLTIRKFVKILERANAKLHYEIYLASSINGVTKFKDTSFIKHWMTELETDKNSDVTIGMDNLTNKISLGDKKIKQ